MIRYNELQLIYGIATPAYIHKQLSATIAHLVDLKLDIELSDACRCGADQQGQHQKENSILFFSLRIPFTYLS